MRVGLILASNVSASPYVKSYVKALQASGLNFDIIAWNRLGLQESGALQFSLPTGFETSYLRRLSGYLRYIQFVKRRLEEGEYDRLVVFTVVPAVLLAQYLRKRYPNKYIVDIRDWSVAVCLWSRRLRLAIEHAASTVVSSPGFVEWLPPNRTYVVCHNWHDDLKLERRQWYFRETPWRILTIGMLRDAPTHLALMRHLGNRREFALEFIGGGPAEPILKRYALDACLTNVRFSGWYEKADEGRLVRGSDFVSALVAPTQNGTTLVTNRLYLGVSLGLPLVANRDTYQGRLIEEYEIGCTVELSGNVAQQLHAYAKSFDDERYQVGRKRFFERVASDRHAFELTIRRFTGESYA